MTIDLVVPVGAESHVVECSGSKLRYFVFNAHKKPTMVMLHGFTGNHRGLLPFIERLADFRLIVPDLPGFGYSTPMTTAEHTIAGYGACIGEFITKLRLARPPILFGHSLGATIAANVAAEFTGLIDDKLILVSPTSVAETNKGIKRLADLAVDWHYRLGAKPGPLGDKVLKSRLFSRASTLALIKTKDKALRRKVYQHHLNDLIFMRHKHIYHPAYRSAKDDDVLRYAPRIAQKTLLIVGSKDAAWPVKQGNKAVAQFKRAQLVILPGIGHLTHFEAPAKTCRIIQQFIAS